MFVGDLQIASTEQQRRKTDYCWKTIFRCQEKNEFTMKPIVCNSVDKKKNNNIVRHMAKPYALLYYPEMTEVLYNTRAESRSSPCTVTIITDHANVQKRLECKHKPE